MSRLERFSYTDCETPLTGWIARPSVSPRGAMVIYPTIANKNAHMERRAAMLAEAGFVVMIADFYGQPVPDFETASALGAQLREDVCSYRRRLSAALEAIKSIAPGLPIGAIGYCMGGQAALEMARDGRELALAASFHGLLQTERRAIAKVPARILVCHGDADPMVPRSDVMAFWEEMDAVKANWHFHAYSDVKHGFTDPASDERGLPAIAYNASADRQSWAALMGLCDEIFG